MAARNRPIPSLNDRARIQTTQLVNRLQAFANGECVLTADRIRAIEILLNKSLPNLSSVESFNQTEVSVISAAPMSPEAWAAAHGEQGGETDGRAN